MTTTVKLSPALSAKLTAEARTRRVSKSQILREMAEDRYFSKRAKRRKTPVSAYDMIKHLAGSCEGPTDLSTNPKYMEGYGE